MIPFPYQSAIIVGFVVGSSILPKIATFAICVPVMEFEWQS